MQARTGIPSLVPVYACISHAKQKIDRLASNETICARPENERTIEWGNARKAEGSLVLRKWNRRKRMYE
jgi:hypothetical protein